MPKPRPVQEQIPTDSRPRDEQAREASGSAVETVPNRPKRSFSAAEKLRILKRADACLASGERGALGAMLRQEAIYSSQLATWRRQLGSQGARGLEPRKSGRKATLDELNDKDKSIARLAKRNAELERRLHVATVLLDLQKKAHELLGIALPATATEEES